MAYELFLCFPLASQRVDELGSHRLAIDSAAARVLGVDLYYRAETDVAMIGLRLDPQTATPVLLGRLREEIEDCGGAVLEPSSLDDVDRQRFYRHYLREYPLRVTDFPTVTDAFRLLGRNMGRAPIQAVPAGSALAVRFRRGEEWQLGRPRHLSREGLYVTTGAPPRRGDVVELRLELPGQLARLRALVVHVTREDAAAAVGGAGFGARFLLDSMEDRQALESLVRETRQDGLHGVCPTPARRDVRYPVRWPVSLETGQGAASGPALDVSWNGMFVAAGVEDAPEHVEILVPIDDEGPPVRCRARVARVVSAEAARARGVASGLGLELEALGDAERFHGFVARVRTRAPLSVLVAGAMPRTAELVAQLAAVGYAVESAEDARTVLGRATLHTPDLVVLDHSFAGRLGPRAQRVRRTLDARNLRVCSVAEGVSAQGVRALADAALLG